MSVHLLSDLLFDDGDDLAFGHRIFFIDQDFLYRATVFGDHGDFHFHGLDNNQYIATFYLVARFRF